MDEQAGDLEVGVALAEQRLELPADRLKSGLESLADGLKPAAQNEHPNRGAAHERHYTSYGADRRRDRLEVVHSTSLMAQLV